MRLAMNPYVTVGVAVVGAIAIVTNPVAAPPPDIRMTYQAVQLTAQPIDVYEYVFDSAVANAQALRGGGAPDPAAIWQEILDNQPATFHELVAAVQSATPEVISQLTVIAPSELALAANKFRLGQVDAAVNTAVGVPFGVVRQILSINPALASAALGIAGPAFSGIGATAAVLQEVLDADDLGDTQGVLNAVIAAPAVIANGALNGGYGPDFSPTPDVTLAGGILSPGSVEPGRVVLPGPIATLQGNGPSSGQSPNALRTPPRQLPPTDAPDSQSIGTGSQKPTPNHRTWHNKVSEKFSGRFESTMTGGNKVSPGTSFTKADNQGRTAVKDFAAEVRSSAKKSGETVRKTADNLRKATGLGRKDHNVGNDESTDNGKTSSSRN